MNDKFLIAVSARKRRLEPSWEQIGYVVIDGVHWPFKPGTHFRGRDRGRRVKTFAATVCTFRPHEFKDPYFQFLSR